MSIQGVRTRRGVRAGALGTAAVLAAVLIPAVTSQAVGETATSTTTAAVLPSTATTLAGLSIGGWSGTVLVSVSASQGSLTKQIVSGVTNSAGFTNSGQSLSFSGNQTDLNAALAGITYDAGSSLGTATVTVNAVQNSTGLSFNPVNNHFYTYVNSGNLSWAAARSAALASTYQGLSGYLVTITSDAENDFVTSKSGGTDLWIGANDTTGGGTPRTWKWMDGPEANTTFTTCSASTGNGSCTTNTYAHWHGSEPNNSGGEYAAVTNVGGANGLWNDLTPGSGTPTGYVVEYGTAAADGGTTSGRASATGSVIVANTPGPITGATIGAVVNGGSLIFTAPSTGATVTGYQYSLNGGTSWNTLPIVNTSGTQRTGLIQGLTAGVTYNVTLRAQSAVGVGATAGPLPVTPTAAPGGGGAGGGGGTTPTAAPTPSPSATPTPTPTPTDPPSPTAPPAAAPVPVAAPVPAPTSAQVTFTQPSTSGVVTSYQYRVNNGPWQTFSVETDSSGQISGTIPGLDQATSYAIDIRAMNALGAGPVTSLSVTTELDTSWYRDPLGAGARAGLIAIPSNPKDYDGKLVYTKARYRSYAGRIVVRVASMAGRPIVKGQGAVVLGSKLFRTGAKGKLVLTAKGRAQARALAGSLRLNAGVRCEGYTDYAGRSSAQNRVAKARAATVCAALDGYTTGTTVRAVSYGARRPVVVGGKHTRRGANYRVVVLVTRNKS